jgi:hypothetical protein
MTIGDLKKLLAPLEDALPIIVVGPCLDEDGDEAEAWFQPSSINLKMDADTAEEYAQFACSRLDDFELP